MPPLKYLAGHPEELQARVQNMIAQGRLGESLRQRYGDVHEVRGDRALYDYATALKQRYLRIAEPLSKVRFDTRLQVIAHALGTHTSVSRVQGTRLKAKREIRIASLFKEAPPEFLCMIVVHGLAHLKEREHGRAFYQLCTHMEPKYHQYEFDLRLYLTHLELGG